MSVVLEMGHWKWDKFHIQQEWYLSQIFTVIPSYSMLSNTILANFYWCFHVHNVQIALLKHMSY